MSGDGLLEIDDCLDPAGRIALPAGVTLISLIDRNMANVGDSVAYRFLDFAGGGDGRVVEITWTRFGERLRAIAAHLQRVAARGDRVAILAPQGLDYVAGFYAAIKAGTIAVPLFAPELRGHAERLEVALRDAEPSVVLTTSAAQKNVHAFLADFDHVVTPRVVLIDGIPDTADVEFSDVELHLDDVSHLQYTSGATRPPVGVEITHRAVGTNLIQMILSIDLLDRKVYGVSWLPLFHDMGLSMIGFPAVYGGHSTLMSPTAFLRRPQRWIKALSDESREGRVVTAAPNFAYEYTAQRGLPGDNTDLSRAVLIVGSEPVSIGAVEKFNAAFAPYGLPPTAFRPSYGIAEATLFVATIAPGAHATARYFDRERLAGGEAVPVSAADPNAIAHVSCGQAARSQWAVIVDADTAAELPDGHVGEIWLHGDNVGRGYWRRPDESQRTFGAELAIRLPGGHAEDAPAQAHWLRTGDLGVYLDGELYVTGRLADLIVIAGRQHYPQDIESTAEQASPMVRPGHVTAFTDAESLVIIAERASGTARVDPAPALAAIRAAVRQRHGIAVSDVQFVAPGVIPRTTSGKLARRACRDAYVSGQLNRR